MKSNSIYLLYICKDKIDYSKTLNSYNLEDLYCASEDKERLTQVGNDVLDLYRKKYNVEYFYFVIRELKVV